MQFRKSSLRDPLLQIKHEMQGASVIFSGSCYYHHLPNAMQTVLKLYIVLLFPSHLSKTFMVMASGGMPMGGRFVFCTLIRELHLSDASFMSHLTDGQLTAWSINHGSFQNSEPNCNHYPYS